MKDGQVLDYILHACTLLKQFSDGHGKLFYAMYVFSINYNIALLFLIVFEQITF